MVKTVADEKNVSLPLFFLLMAPRCGQDNGRKDGVGLWCNRRSGGDKRLILVVEIGRSDATFFRSLLW